MNARVLRFLGPILVGLAVAGAPARAHADDDSAASDDRAAAAREFAEGQRAFAAGDYRLAAEQFEAAYKHKPHHSSLWNAARARQRAGDIARAANLYARYLREAPPNARDRNNAQSSLRQLASKLGQLEITAVGLEEVRVDREPADGRIVYVNPGAHVVEAKVPKSDRAVTQPTSVDAGQTVSVALVAPATPTESTANGNAGGSTATTPQATTTPPPSSGGGTETPPLPKKGGGRPLPPVVVYVGAGLTVVSAGLSVVSGLDVLNQKSTFDKDQSQANLDAGKSKQLRTNILLGVTAGLAVLTGVCAIWLVDWRGGSRRQVQVGLGFENVALRGSF